jgi:hypothetical protein
VRGVLVTLAVAATALTAATSGASQGQPHVSVSVTPSRATPTGGRTPLGRRAWSVSFHVSVSSESACENLSVAYSYWTLFNGRASPGERVSESFDTRAPASSAAFDVRISGVPAEIVTLRARGTCEQEDGTVLSGSAAVFATVRIPAHPCEGGPLRVLALRGSARRADRDARVRVRTGHYLRTSDAVTLGRRSSLVFGARECRGLRVAVSTPRSVSIVPGDYARGSEGFPTTVGSGGTAEFRGDQHSGGVQSRDAIALPRGARRGPSKIARVRVVTLRRMTTVRVRTGVVYVAPRLGRSTYGKAIVVRAGQTARCAARACAPAGR